MTRDEYIAWLGLDHWQAAAYHRLSDLRDAGYTGPVDADGFADTTSEEAGILRRMAVARGEEVDW